MSAAITAAETTQLPEVCKACVAGDVDKVRGLIENDGISPDFKQPNSNFTLLMFAAHEGHADLVRYLLKAGATVDTGGLKAAGTAMMQCVENQKANIVEILLEAGSDVSARDPARNTAIFYAASNNDMKMLELLHRFKADINVKNMNNHTPLHSAAREGHADAISWLIKHGCEVNTPNVRQWSPLHVAVLKGNKEAARVLAEQGGKCCLDCVKCTSLLALCERFGKTPDGTAASVPKQGVNPQQGDAAKTKIAAAAAATAEGAEKQKEEGAAAEEEDRLKVWLKPEVGYCLKTKQIQKQTLKKVFINVCRSEKVPMVEVGADNKCDKVPCMFAEPRREKDKSGAAALCLDCCISEVMFEKVIANAVLKEELSKTIMQCAEGYFDQVLQQQMMLVEEFHVLNGVKYKTGIPPARTFVRAYPLNRGAGAGAGAGAPAKAEAVVPPAKVQKKPSVSDRGYFQMLELSGNDEFISAFERTEKLGGVIERLQEALDIEKQLDLAEDILEVERKIERWRVNNTNNRILSKAENILQSMRRRYNIGPSISSTERAKMLSARQEALKDDPCPRQMLALIKLGLETKPPAEKKALESQQRTCKFLQQRRHSEEQHKNMLGRLKEEDEELSKLIRKKYRRLALQLHPDKLRRPRTTEDEQKFESLQQAFDVLNDVAERKKYIKAPSHDSYRKSRDAEADQKEAAERAAEQKQQAAVQKKAEAERQAKIDKHWDKQEDKGKGKKKSKPASSSGVRQSVGVEEEDDDDDDDDALLFHDAPSADSAFAAEGAPTQTAGGAKQRRRRKDVISYAKLKNMQGEERKLWELTMREQREADEAADKVKKLTCGEPNKCSVPRVVREEGTNAPDGSKLYQLHLQWRCKYGLTSGKPERYQVQCIKGLSSEVEVVYEGEDQFFVTKALPDGMYSFKARATNYRGAGQWSESNTVHLDVKQTEQRSRRMEQERIEMQREQQSHARQVLKALLMDHKVLGVVRSARKREELLKEVKDTVRKALHAGMGGPDNMKGDAEMLKQAQSILDTLKEKKKQQEQAKETKLDLRARVQQALENGSEVRA
jgi:ankyrin repeat protein/curved DNA-binding protein CbpA